MEDLAEYIDWEEFEWVIIGAETGNRKEKIVPRREWVAAIVEKCHDVDVPVFLKKNIAVIWGEDPPKEFPKQLITPSWKNRPVHKVFIESVRDKKKCQQCKVKLQGKPAVRISARFYLCEDCYRGCDEE